ncbi:hypothetical protein SAMN05444000_107152 [Shimia gijangensis]|uniref:Uncharacterized protein n=1 Tax=Shimia gijangensis TaxID=1470563 RepID=A0A1M6IKS1_9RHOB|nr:hypothetical protein [Shimia gijangensis]SHJ34983.1 hypothetical protein SAMN05444000_107152 [Shimia gijangensis]
MKPYTKALIALTLVTVVTYGVLVGVGASNLTLGEDNLKPFDLRFSGYTLAEAQTYLALMTAEQSALYIGFLRYVDTAFPMLMGLWMGWCLWGLTRAVHPWSRIILLVVPASFTVMDLCENALVSDMVMRGTTGLEAGLVTLASSYTITKYVMLSVAFGLLLAMMIYKTGFVGRGRKG